jgi:radical SAM-linked protein
MVDPNQPAKFRLRLVFAKKAQIKYLGHLDLSLAWERALRRAQLPLAYSKGFNPRPRMQFASELPLGTMSRAEILDVVLYEEVEVEEVYERLKGSLPVGVEVYGVESVPVKSATLQQLLRQADYRVLVETEVPAAELSARIAALLGAEKVVQRRERRKRVEEVDLRPLLYALKLERGGEFEVELQMRLAAGQSGNLRPEAVLKALGLEGCWAEVERAALIFEPNSPEVPK